MEMDNQFFSEIPVLYASGVAGPITDCGAGNYNIKIEDVVFENYVSQLETLSTSGFIKYVDNGPAGLNGSVWTTTYTKDDLVVTVSYMKKRGCMYISAGKKLALSPHLFYDESYLKGNIAGSKTSLHMLELHTFGDSFVIQLKNGHFIMDDSGMPMDAQYLLDYLEELTPNGETPIIEAWFISHGHGDHSGAFIAFANNPEYAKRVCVEGIYYSEPNVDICKMGDSIEQVQVAVKGFGECKTSSGKTTPVYRPQVGQRYYFNDIMIDVLHTQEQLPMQDYSNGFNDSSTWLLYSIDGQKFLHGGDAGRGSVEVVKDTYEQEFLDFDIMTTFHHGQNVSNSFVEYFNYKTVLYTTFVVGSQTANWKTEENKKLQERAEECLSWGDGTKILKFPYYVGDFISLPRREWIYHPDRKSLRPFSLDE